MSKNYVWTRADMGINDLTEFVNDHNLKPGEFQLAPFQGGDMVTVIYLAATI